MKWLRLPQLLLRQVDDYPDKWRLGRAAAHKSKRDHALVDASPLQEGRLWPSPMEDPAWLQKLLIEGFFVQVGIHFVFEVSVQCAELAARHVREVCVDGHHGQGASARGTISVHATSCIVARLPIIVHFCRDYLADGHNHRGGQGSHQGGLLPRGIHNKLLLAHRNPRGRLHEGLHAAQHSRLSLLQRVNIQGDLAKWPCKAIDLQLRHREALCRQRRQRGLPLRQNGLKTLLSKRKRNRVAAGGDGERRMLHTLVAAVSMLRCLAVVVHRAWRPPLRPCWFSTLPLLDLDSGENATQIQRLAQLRRLHGLLKGDVHHGPPVPWCGPF
mmetsp:Transcript_36276/g.84386  ORF Transcript_36276/g.84386 Transcript_36276/m.84386 type:complete len:328 (-) Transcript_36276:15-998(-)